jgi:hypothetical protein
MYKVIPILALVFCSGCLGPRYQEPYQLREEKATITTDEGLRYVIFTRIDADVYWVPRHDVTQLKFKTIIVEVEVHRIGYPGTILSRVDLMKQSGVNSENPPFFLGASVQGSFWAINTGAYFFVESATGKVTKQLCDRRFLMFGNWEQVGAKAIRRKNEYGVFEFTPEGAKQVEGEPLP